MSNLLDAQLYLIMKESIFHRILECIKGKIIIGDDAFTIIPVLNEAIIRDIMRMPVNINDRFIFFIYMNGYRTLMGLKLVQQVANSMLYFMDQDEGLKNMKIETKTAIIEHVRTYYRLDFEECVNTEWELKFNACSYSRTMIDLNFSLLSISINARWSYDFILNHNKTRKIVEIYPSVEEFEADCKRIYKERIEPMINKENKRIESIQEKKRRLIKGQFPNALRVSLKELQKSDLKSVLSILQSDHEHDIRKLGDNFQVINSEEKRIYGNMKRRRRLVSCLIGNYDSLEPNLIDQFPIQKVKSKYVYSITNKGEMIGDSQVYTYASDIKLNNDQVCNAVARQQFGLNGYMDLNELMQFNIIEDELKIDEQKTIMDYEVGSTSVQYSSIFGEADWNDKNNSNCGGNFVRAHGLIDDSTQSITIGELSKKLSSRAYYMVLPNGRVFSQKRSSNHRLKQQKPIFAYLNNNFVYAIETPRIQQLVSAGRNILSLKKSHINPKDKFTVLPDYKFDKKEAMNFRQIIITKQNLNKVILKNMRDKNIFPDAISSDGVSITLARYANHILFANPDYERNCGLMHKIRETVSESLAATIDVHLNSTADIINLLLEHVTEHENWKSELNEHTYEIINQLPKKFADMRKDYINSFNLEKHVYCINNYLQHVMVNRLQGWPVYCRSDQPMEYDNSEIRPGAYHLKTRIEFMPQIYLTGWQDSILIEYMLQEKLISKSDIDYMLKAKYGLAHDIFEKIYKQIAITSEEMESFLCCKNVTKNMNTAFLSTSSCLRNTKEFANYRYANISSEKPVYVFYLDEKMESLCNFRPMYKSVIGSIFVLIRQLFFTVKSENSQLLAITGNSIIITRPNKDADMRVSLDSGKYRKKDAVPLKWHLPFHWWSDITPENPEEYEYLEQFQKPHIYIKPKFVEYNQESKSGKEAIEYKLNYMQANILDHYNANEIVSLKKLDGFRIKPFVRISKKGSKYLLAVIHKSNLARKQITKYFVIPKRTARIRMLLLNLQNYLKGVYNNEMNDQIDSFFKSARYNELRDICFEYSKNNRESKFEMELNM